MDKKNCDNSSEQVLHQILEGLNNIQQNQKDIAKAIKTVEETIDFWGDHFNC